MQGEVESATIGIKSPAERISAGAYAKLVLDEIKNIQSRKHVPIICGGSGLYFSAILIFP